MAADAPHHLGLVLGPGPEGRCDDYKVGIGTPQFDLGSDRWLMWYYCRDRAFPKHVAPTLGSGRIALATSRDGKVWDRFVGPLAGGAVIEPTSDAEAFDALHIGNTDVTFAKGHYWLWYFGGNKTPAKTSRGDVVGLAMLPGLAKSRDGVTWEKVRGPGRGGALFDQRPGDVFASWTNGTWDGDKFIQWYTATDAAVEKFRTYVAVSRDGVRWDQLGPITFVDGDRIFDGLGIMTRQVQRNPFQPGPKWLMLYTALDAAPERKMKRSIAVATSDDGLSWRRMFDRPVFEAGDVAAWDGGGVAGPQLVVTGGELRLYYFGFPTTDREGSLPKGVGLAIAPCNDLRGFRRVAG